MVKKIKKYEEETDRREKIAINFFSIMVLILLVGFVVLNIGEIKQITGYGTAAQVNVTISQNLTINVIQRNMSLGVGQVKPGQVAAAINSSTKLPTITTTMLNAANWINSSVFNPLSIVIRNDGNVNASITFTSNKVAAAFIGGTGPSFQYNSSNNETGSCLSGLVAAFTEVAAGDGANSVCTNLGSLDTRDEVKLDVNLSIPQNAYGEKVCDWNFTASAVT